MASNVEKKIVKRIIADALAANLSISVFDGEKTVLRQSTYAKTIIGEMFSTGEDTLRFFDTTGKKIGWVLLIEGNEHDIISDSSTEIDWLLDPIMDFAGDLS